MKVCRSIGEIKSFVRSAKSSGNTIGLVPTMGYFHQGHLSLMRLARQECQIVVVSLFVNPTQFGPGEDLLAYPKDFERDVDMASREGVDVIFSPEPEEMYPPGYQTYVEVGEITTPLCGRSRPGHFRGVATVVNKLFHLVEPDRAYFGQKDAQQVMVIKQMVRDLNMNVEIVNAPIVREDDGLAMSSRNVYLSTAERKTATVLSRSLQGAEHAVNNGETDALTLRKQITEKIKSESMADIDYVEILSIPNLEPIQVLHGQVLIALAVRFGKTRLIDNTIVEV
ncbi:MAG: pantoate--beta-alanine ligase [Firmicutes bacterium]|nr:pantoate--beta-alanine ligase [Bacillota bacterium]